MRPIIVFAFMCLCATSQAQIIKPYEILPKTPDASVFERIEMNTTQNGSGLISIEVPLGSVQIRGCKVPLSLRYDPTGIKTTDIETTVGLGWVLDAGGMMSRTIFGIPDEILERGWETYRQNYRQCIPQSILKLAYDQMYDTSPDLYSYSVNGKSGVFFMNDSCKLVKMLSSDSYKIDKRSSGVAITDEFGNKYLYDTPEAITSVSYNKGNVTNLIYGAKPTTWKLTAMTNPMGETISFGYKKYAFESPCYLRKNEFIVEISNANDFNIHNNSYFNYITGKEYYDTQLLEEIKTLETRVKFEYGDIDGAVIKKTIKGDSFF